MICIDDWLTDAADWIQKGLNITKEAQTSGANSI